jgi:hypothetical protein
MSLKDDLLKIKENAPEPIQQMIKSEKERLESSGLLESCLNAGDRIPNFSLPNHYGELISSDKLLPTGPLVIAFYRGGW